ncbi:universal stress protein [Caldimonas sp.]|uniref:universal stress protein n=1 Tax=Caldimonas sp. TaxID=2838790 RepID=UPI00307E0A4F
MKILLPVDGSELSLWAVRHAIALARSGLQAHFVLANVQEPPTLYEVVTAHDAEVLEGMAASAGRHALEAAETLLREAGLPYDLDVVSGAPAQAIIDLTETHGCQAIVMGARGIGTLRAGLFGSVSRAVLDHSPVPVTIVKPPEADTATDTAGDASDEAAGS